MRLVPILFAATFIGCTAREVVTRVTVRDHDFKVIRTLTDTMELASFMHAWDQKTEASFTTNPNWAYKVDVHGPNGGQRWLYDPSGWAEPLRVKGGPLYQIEQPGHLNEILGIPNSRLQRTAANRPFHWRGRR